jgi:hypothetical protein
MSYPDVLKIVLLALNISIKNISKEEITMANVGIEYPILIYVSP